MFGTEAARLAPYPVARLRVGYVPEGRRVFANLTVEDNLKVPQGVAGTVRHPAHLRSCSHGWRSAG